MTYASTASQAALTYRTQDIGTADPVGLIVRVFDEALRSLSQARAALGRGDMAAKGGGVQQAARCISLLQNNLDVERGGEVAANLDRVYVYLQRRLTQAHLRNDDEALEEIARHVSELASAWRTLERSGAAPAEAQ